MQPPKIRIKEVWIITFGWMHWCLLSGGNIIASQSCILFVSSYSTISSDNFSSLKRSMAMIINY